MKIKQSLSRYSGCDNFDVFKGPILSVGLYHPHPLQDTNTLWNSSKNGVFTIQPLCGRKSHKELTSVCVWSCIGHRQNTSS